ncbi:hypothetical protein [Acinetobacter variabilis]|uniref:hypothetical protein n=1 Tax=Acinetobacter variabilis TaxID=70346 RepID=UPI0028AC3DA9|nr:hypothetical protein [Acinetobacter variabilis]
MKKLKIEDFQLLSDELYLQTINALKLKNFIKTAQKSKKTENEEDIQRLSLSSLEKKQLLKVLEELGDKSFNELLWQNSPWDGDEVLMNFNPKFTARKTLQLIKRIDKLVEDYSDLATSTLHKEYKLNLETLIDMITPRQSVLYGSLYSVELRRKIQGYIAINKRHEVKHKIFFDTLLEYADKHGKWGSPSMAVRDVYTKVVEKFKEMDRQYIEEQLKKYEVNKQMVSKEKEELEWLIDNLEARKVRKIEGSSDGENLNSAREKQRKLVEELQILEFQILRYSDAKKHGYPFESLGREIFFNNNDNHLSLINCLRNNKEIMSQVIVS